MPISLILADNDTSYVQSVADWILVHPEYGFEPVLADGQSKLTGRASGSAAIILFSEDHLLEEGTDMAECKAIRLIGAKVRDMNESESAGKQKTNFPSIHKYQPMPAFLQEIKAIAVSKGWIHTSSAVGPVRKSLVVHLSGSSHQQPLAPMLAAAFAMDTAVLFVDADVAGHGALWFPQSEGDGLSRILFWIRSGMENWHTRFMSCLQKDSESGVFAIREASMPADKEGFSASDALSLVSAAVENQLNHLFLDAGMGLSERNRSLIQIADDVFFISSIDAESLRLCKKAIDGFADMDVDHAQEKKFYWLFCGNGTTPLPSVPEGHEQIILADPYPNGFPGFGWRVSDVFADDVKRLAQAMRSE